jgi:paraquat-inducible protein B
MARSVAPVLAPVFVGAFVLGALALLVVALLIVGAARFGGAHETVVAYFRSSVTGLTVGAPVVLKGVQIGVVREIQVAYDDASGGFLVPVHLEIDQAKVVWPGQVQAALGSDETWQRALREGLRGRLGLQSFLTGLLQVEVDFFPGAPLILTGRDPDARELPTIPSELERFREELLGVPITRVVEQAVAALDGLTRLLAAPELARTLAQLDTGSRELALAAEDLHHLIEPTGRRLNAALSEAEQALARLAPRMDTLVDSLTETSGAIGGLARRADAEIPPLVGDLRAAAQAAQSALASAEGAFRGVGDLVDQRSPVVAEVLSTLRALSAAARSLHALSDYLERHPEALLQGKR